MKKCKGTNCTAINGEGHSEECIAEHDHVVAGGVFDTAGNRHPEYRYDGYKGRPLDKSATLDQKRAWEEGHAAREDNV